MDFKQKIKRKINTKCIRNIYININKHDHNSINICNDYGFDKSRAEVGRMLRCDVSDDLSAPATIRFQIQHIVFFPAFNYLIFAH